MTPLNIAVYLLLGLLGMGFISLSLIILSYAYLKAQEDEMIIEAEKEIRYFEKN